MKVLIVDGSKAERARLVDAFCELTNFVVIGAVARLHTALHALGQSSPDVLVTDSRLGDDEDAAHLVAAARRSACPPGIVVYSTADSAAERRRVIDAGADRFVAKHAGFPALQQAVFEVGSSRTTSMRMPYERAFAGRIAAGIAHDLNNQLTVIDAALGLIQKQLAAGKPTSELALARRALDQASSLSQALGKHSHRIVEPARLVDLPTVVRRAFDLFGRSIPLHVETSLALEETAPIRAVEPELEQLVMNLALDACEAMPSGGTLSIRVHSPTRSKVQLVVARSGNPLPVTVDFDVAPT